MVNPNANELTVVDSYLLYGCPAEELAPLTEIFLFDGPELLTSNPQNAASRRWGRCTLNRLRILCVYTRIILGFGY